MFEQSKSALQNGLGRDVCNYIINKQMYNGYDSGCLTVITDYKCQKRIKP